MAVDTKARSKGFVSYLDGLANVPMSRSQYIGQNTKPSVRLQGLVDTFKNRQEKFGDIVSRRQLVNSLPEKFQTPEALSRLNATLPPEERIIDSNAGEIVLSAVGQGAGMTGDILGESLAALGDAFTPDVLGVGKKFDSALESVMSTDAAKQTTEMVLDFSEENPRTAENLGNVFNIGSLGVGNALRKRAGAANKGAWAAGVKNYIDNFYGNDKPDIDPTFLEKTLGEIALDYAGEKSTASKTARAGKKVVGIMKWGVGGAASAIDSMFNPYSRALYKETGISRKGAVAVDKLMVQSQNIDKKLEQLRSRKQSLVKGSAEWDINKKEISTGVAAKKRIRDKAVAQVTYNRHLIEQSNRKGNLGSSLLEIEDFNNLQGYADDTIENFISGANATKFNTLGKTHRSTAKSTLTQAYQRINKAWGNKGKPNSKVVFKEPSGGSSGNHFSDLAAGHPALGSIRQVISGNKKTLDAEDFYNQLKTLANKKKSGFTINDTWADAKKNGIWVQAGMQGSSVVEGGINGLLKVLPNGKAVGFMSDIHDFLEKLPVVGKMLDESLPNRLMAVSGPIHMDIMNTKWAEKAVTKKGETPFTKKPSPTPNKRTDRPEAEAIIESYTNTKPSVRGVADSMDGYLATGLMTGSTGGEVK
tara:strand:- start:10 stop:1944 length:1935 start_codon:yes stop_codon:yes gene_type:complete